MRRQLEAISLYFEHLFLAKGSRGYVILENKDKNECTPLPTTNKHQRTTNESLDSLHRIFDGRDKKLDEREQKVDEEVLSRADAYQAEIAEIKTKMHGIESQLSELGSQHKIKTILELNDSCFKSLSRPLYRHSVDTQDCIRDYTSYLERLFVSNLEMKGCEEE